MVNLINLCWVRWRVSVLSFYILPNLAWCRPSPNWKHLQIRFVLGLPSRFVSSSTLGGSSTQPQGNSRGPGFERSQIGSSHLEARGLLPKCQGGRISICDCPQRVIKNKAEWTNSLHAPVGDVLVQGPENDDSFSDERHGEMLLYLLFLSDWRWNFRAWWNWISTRWTSKCVLWKLPHVSWCNDMKKYEEPGWKMILPNPKLAHKLTKNVLVFSIPF